MCSVCRSNNGVLFHVLLLDFNKNNTTGSISELRTSYPSGAPELLHVLNGVPVGSNFSFLSSILSIVLCLFVLLVIVCPSSNYGFWLDLWCLQTISPLMFACFVYKLYVWWFTCRIYFIYFHIESRFKNKQ
jgi:hypothetical protein